MPVKYSLHPNHLNGNKGTYYAQVDYRAVVDLNELIEHMLKSGSSISKSDILAVYHEFQEAICYFLKEGYYVNTPLVKVYPSIAGKFAGSEAAFNKNTNVVSPCVSPGKVLMKTVKEASVEKVHPKFQKPIFNVFNDINSGKSDSEITPGGIASLKGKNLKINKADSEQGIFFINNSGDRFKVEHVVQTTNTELIFQIPSILSSGDYKLAIIQIIKNNKKKQINLFENRLFVK
ncbi:MAG TPA: DNA-binding domain-containing protein [Cytophagales bacterium]|nr:DNA-binding domain-containing protein [Cytophagales bacterium]